jgi:hypothetical protein
LDALTGLFGNRCWSGKANQREEGGIMFQNWETLIGAIVALAIIISFLHKKY